MLGLANRPEDDPGHPRNAAITAWARRAFEAYAEAVGGKTVIGTRIPSWDDLGDKVRGGWIAAARAVRDA